jgi:hypothetical protein
MDSGKVEIEISIRLRGNQNDVNQESFSAKRDSLSRFLYPGRNWLCKGQARRPEDTLTIKDF